MDVFVFSVSFTLKSMGLWVEKLMVEMTTLSSVASVFTFFSLVELMIRCEQSHIVLEGSSHYYKTWHIARL